MADLYRITVEGAGGSARHFSQAQRKLQNAIIRAFRDLGSEAEQTYRDYAPEDRGQIKERTHAFVYFGQPSRPRVTVRTFARDPESGYAYVRVTRFGHRKAIIFPKRARALAVHYAGHRNPHIVKYADHVLGADPQSDWAEDAGRVVDQHVNRTMSRLGRSITTEVL